MSLDEPKIGPYTLVSLLGRGGFGEVWLAERRSSLITTRVALKLPLLDDVDYEEIRREAQTWLQASGHPNIVPVLDAEVYDGRVVIASEYIAGGTLTQWLHKHGGSAPSIDAAASKCAAILSGLDYLHRCGVVHRDLKPDNVLLQDGTPRLTDFGLARFEQHAGGDDSICGTPKYMAPEAFGGAGSPACDLWAVGVIFYEMLAGALPFPQMDIIELIGAIQGASPPPLPPTVPEILAQNVRTLLSRSPAERYATAGAALDAMRAEPSVRMDVGEPVPAQTPLSAPQHNLPVQPSTFVGRDRELASAADLMRSCRLLTLTGSGGSGKTRLALRAAEQAAAEYPNGVWWADLAPLAAESGANLVAGTIAAVIDVKEAPGQSILRTLTAALKIQKTLILIDNCEHVINGAAEVIGALMQSCPDVLILATSREPLNVTGEQTYRVPSLGMPGDDAPSRPKDLLQHEAIRLFADRAVSGLPGFELTEENACAVVSICRRLDGIPLAIELAAARTRSLSPQQIAAKLDDRFRLLTGGSRTALPRQQTLRSLVDWSYSLLTEPERTLLRRVSVFAGGWTLETAEAVCSDTEGTSDETPIESWEIVDLLTALHDKSMIVVERHQGASRYRLLETIRQYAAELLAQSGERGRIRDAHRDAFLAMAEDAVGHYARATQAEWLARLDTEHDNLRSALEWSAAESDGIEPGLRLSAALWRFWHIRGYLSEGRSQLTRALDRTDATVRTLSRAHAMNGCALLTWYQGDGAAAEPMYDEALSIAREFNDRESMAASILGMGLVVVDTGRLDGAVRLFDEARSTCRDIGDGWGESLALNNLGLVAAAQGDIDRSIALHEEGLTIRRAMNDRWGLAMSLNNLGALFSIKGDSQRARALLYESLALRHEIHDRAGIVYNFEEIAALMARDGDVAAAARVLGAEDSLREIIGAAEHAVVRANLDPIVQRIRGGSRDPECERAWVEGRSLSLPEAVDYALRALDTA